MNTTRVIIAALALFALAAAVAGHNRAITPPYSEREYHAGKTAYRAGRYDEAEQHFNADFRRSLTSLRCTQFPSVDDSVSSASARN